MTTLTSNYTKFNLTKGLIILFYTWLIYMDISLLSNNFAYIITGETAILGIFLISINKEEKQLISILQILISILQTVAFILILFFLSDYRDYYISSIMIKYWTIFQAIYLALFFTFIIQNYKRKIPLFVLLIAGVALLALITVFKKTLHGDNSHLYKPLMGFGLYYIFTAFILKNTVGKLANK